MSLLLAVQGGAPAVKAPGPVVRLQAIVRGAMWLLVGIILLRLEF